MLKGKCQGLSGGREWDFSTPSQHFRCRCAWKFPWAVRFKEVVGADSLVMGGGVVLGVIVTHVLETRMPMDTELLSCNLIGNPEIAHLHGSRSLAFDGVVCNACGS